MKLRFILTRTFLAGLLLAGGVIHAADPPTNAPAPAPAQAENRFLFLIDTARAMRGYSNAIVQDVVELMVSNLRGELRPGDTLGVWTYNNNLHADFPMEVWSPEDKSDIINQMGEYLVSRKFEKSARLEKAMPALLRVVQKSDRLTAILIFDGGQMIEGTPFDKEIDALEKKYARDLKKAHEPFVLVLAARKGAIFDFTINYPGAIAIPHTAIPEKPVETNAPVAMAKAAPTNAPAVVQRRKAPSIIMSHGTNVVQNPRTNPLQAGDALTIDFSGAPARLPSIHTEIKGDGTIHLDFIGDVQAVGKTPGELERDIQNAYVPAYYAQLSVSVTKTSVLTKPPPASATPTPKVTQPATSVPLEAAPPPATAAVAAPPVVTPAPAPPPVVTPAPEQKKQDAVVAVAPVQPPPASPPLEQPVSAPPKTAKSPPPLQAPVADNVVTSNAAPTAASATPPPAAPPPPAALAGATPAGGSQSRLFIIASLLLTVAAALLVLLLRRPKGRANPSLISQSIDRPR